MATDISLFWHPALHRPADLLKRQQSPGFQIKGVVVLDYEAYKLIVFYMQTVKYSSYHSKEISFKMTKVTQNIFYLTVPPIPPHSSPHAKENPYI